MEIPVYIMLGLTSVVGLAFIVERALALRWRKVVPPEITASLATCETREDANKLCRVCKQKPYDLNTPRLTRILALSLILAGTNHEDARSATRLIRACPKDAALLNDTAWILATSPEASLRNGVEAVELAQRAVELSGGQEPAILDTLAAAYAEAGRFAEAVQTAQKAAKLATQQNKQALAESIKARIRLYEAETPFRATPPPLLQLTIMRRSSKARNKHHDAIPGGPPAAAAVHW